MVDKITLTTGLVFQQLYTYRNYVKKAVIQNISTEDVTIDDHPGGVQSQGIILNAADLAGKAGGQLEIEAEKDEKGAYIKPVDISEWWFVRTTSGLTLSVTITR